MGAEEEIEQKMLIFAVSVARVAVGWSGIFRAHVSDGAHPLLSAYGLSDARLKCRSALLVICLVSIHQGV